MVSIERLQEKLGYTFTTEALLTRAVTHRSFGADNNERLEFLGDAILNFLIAEELYLRFGSAREGKMSRLRAQMVKRETLAAVARDLSVGDHLQMGSGELKSGGFDRDSILADALEAIIGAVYLDSDMGTVRDCLLQWFEDRLDVLSLDKSQKDAKSRLQELLQARGEPLPDYEVVGISGKSHDQIFIVQCRATPLVAPVEGRGTSRRGAEQAAASVALEQLEAGPEVAS